MTVIRDKQFIMAFGKHLRVLREDKGFSQSYLSAIANIPKSQISRIERGEVNPTINTVKVIAEALGVNTLNMFEF